MMRRGALHAFMAVVGLVAVSVLAGSAAGQAPAGPQQMGKPVRAVAAAELARIVANAPAIPVKLELGLKTRLIDFIDCTSDKDPHDFIDLGTSKVVKGAAGAYRVTAPHRHAFFSYGFKTAGRDKPVLIVIEYPDDEERIISFMTHDSMRATTPHTSFSQETGVYTGGQYPLSGGMRYFTLISYPQDDWSPLLVLNFGRVGGAGAASRIWVQAIDEIEPLKVDAPTGAQRELDVFFPVAFLAKRDNFGWQSPKSIENMIDYMRVIGLTRATMMVYANQSWGAMCTIPSWDANDKGYLEDILKQMDRKAGAGGDIKLIAGIVANGMYGVVKSGGKEVAGLPPEELRAVIIKGLDEFIDLYGKYKSLGGMAFGSMEAVGFMDLLRDKGILADVVAHVKSRRPDWEVLTYVGNFYLQNPHFGGKEAPTPWQVVQDWEASGENWPLMMGRRVVENWRNWKRDPAELKKIAGLNVYEMYVPDDHRLHGLYRTHARQAMLLDTETSMVRSAAADTPYASIFGTFTEGWIGLHKEVNWHYTKPWTGPELNPPAEIGMAAWTRAMWMRDRFVISAGGWSVKHFGLEVQMRRFAENFRRLPAVEMTDVTELPLDTVAVRWVIHEGKRYVAVMSKVPFAGSVTVDGREIELPPYELVTFADDGGVAPVVTGKAPAAYVDWVRERLDTFAALYEDVKKLNAAAAPEVYMKPHGEAMAALTAGKVWTADQLLGAGLVGELELRQQILSPAQLHAGRIARQLTVDGKLDDWPAAFEISAETSRSLTGHVYFPNDWRGANDLSARVRLAHDGERMYFGADISDDVWHGKDSLTLHFSRAGYLDWREENQKFDMNVQVAAPKDDEPVTMRRAGVEMVARRRAGGYVVEGSITLEQLKVAAGGRIGMLVMVSDIDTPLNLNKASWSVKQILLIPNEPNFAYWSDARTCGEILFEE